MTFHGLIKALQMSPIDPSPTPHNPQAYHIIVCVHGLCIYVYKFLVFNMYLTCKVRQTEIW